MKKKRKRKREEGGCGLIGWADGSWARPAALSISYFFPSFFYSFLFSVFFCIFCILTPFHVKPNGKFSKIQNNITKQ
jgi:hypothetical protein